MPCIPFRTESGATGIACVRTTRCKCGSGRAVTLLCDWKTGEGTTCDAKLCSACTSKPAKGKDLCPAHAAEREKRKASR